MAATESAQIYTQTGVMLMKYKIEYGRDIICTDLHSDWCYVDEIVGRIWPRHNLHRFTLRLVLCS
jgi:hypothetical protein